MKGLVSEAKTCRELGDCLVVLLQTLLQDDLLAVRSTLNFFHSVKTVL